MAVPDGEPPNPPESITPPAGANATALTVCDGWIAAVASSGWIPVRMVEGATQKNSCRIAPTA